MRYPALIWREGKDLLAEFPDCPGCQTFAGPNRDIDAEAKEALEGWLESCLIDGTVPPVPSKSLRHPPGKHVRWIEVSPNLDVKLQLRLARNALNLTQTQLAKRAGISQQMVAKLEHPRYSPGLPSLGKVTAALGMRIRVKLEKVTNAA